MSVHVAGRELSPTIALRAIRLEVAGQPRPLKLWLGFLTVLIAIGAVGAVIAIPPGWEVLGTSASFEWGILITAYVFFAITTSGLCLASSLGTVFNIPMFMPLEKRHAILAVLCLCTAFGIIAIDLHYPVRLVFGAVLSPSPFSPMWWMGVFYGVYLVFLLTEVASMFTGHWSIHRVACVLSSITAIFAPLTLGAVFAVLASRPFWHGAFTPPFMITSAFLSGTALLGIVFYWVVRLRLAAWERAESLAIPAIRLLLTIALTVIAFFLVLQTIVGLYGTVPGLADATLAMLVGPLAPEFWILRVGLGLVVPLALLVLPRTRTPDGLFAASVLAFAGLFFDRVVFVNAGQIVPSTTASGVVSAPFNEYTPSPVEISIVVAAFALVALVYTLAERFLDMSEHSGHLAGVPVTVGGGPAGAHLPTEVDHVPALPPTPVGTPAPLPTPVAAAVTASVEVEADQAAPVAPSPDEASAAKGEADPDASVTDAVADLAAVIDAADLPAEAVANARATTEAAATLVEVSV